MGILDVYDDLAKGPGRPALLAAAPSGLRARATPLIFSAPRAATIWPMIVGSTSAAYLPNR